MKVAQARALVPGLMVFDADPEGDAAEWLGWRGGVCGMRRWRRWMRRMVFGLMFRVRRICMAGRLGCCGTWSGGWGEQGLRVRAAVADTPAVAHAVARFAEGGVVPPGASVLADLPIEALRLPVEVSADLRLMGFDRIGPLAAAARAPLVRRYGTLLACGWTRRREGCSSRLSRWSRRRWCRRGWGSSSR